MKVITLLCAGAWLTKFLIVSAASDSPLFWILLHFLMFVFFSLLYVKQNLKEHIKGVYLLSIVVGLLWLCVSLFVVVDTGQWLMKKGIEDLLEGRWLGFAYRILYVLSYLATACAFVVIGLKKFFSPKVKLEVLLFTAMLAIQGFMAGYGAITTSASSLEYWGEVITSFTTLGFFYALAMEMMRNHPSLMSKYSLPKHRS